MRSRCLAARGFEIREYPGDKHEENEVCLNDGPPNSILYLDAGPAGIRPNPLLSFAFPARRWRTGLVNESLQLRIGRGFWGWAILGGVVPYVHHREISSAHRATRRFARQCGTQNIGAGFRGGGVWSGLPNHFPSRRLDCLASLGRRTRRRADFRLQLFGLSLPWGYGSRLPSKLSRPR